MQPNWKYQFYMALVMAPIETIDCVVVHELFHIRIKNHSQEFWQSINNIVPEYRKYHHWLTENQNLLTL
jgi:hypothetical protein